MSWNFTNKKAKDAYEYVLSKKDNCKRPVFDIEWLDEWLEWLAEHNYLFLNYKNGQVDGVITIFPIERTKNLNSLKHILSNITVKYHNRNYFIMDALVDNPEARVNIIKQILNTYPEIEQDSEVQLLACRRGKVTKLNKLKILTLKSNGF